MLFPILVAVMAALAIGVVAWPILQNTRRPTPMITDELAELAAQRDAALKAVKDLEFDYQVGKVTVEDYPVYDRRLKEQALAAIQAYDAADAAAAPTTRPSAARREERIEAEIATLRRAGKPRSGAQKPRAAQAQPHDGFTQIPGRPEPAAAEDALEAEIAVLRRQTAQPVAAIPRFCSQCGQPLRPDDRFCSACGAPVAVPAV